MSGVQANERQGPIPTHQGGVVTDHRHYEGCHLHHFPCALERIRALEKENRRLIDERIVSALVHHEMRAHAAPPVYLGAPPSVTGNKAEPPRIVTHATVIPCSDPYFTHHGDEPPSSTL